MPWIHHPACQDGPVGVVRWLKYHAALFLERLAHKWERDAVDPGWRERDDDLPF